MAAIDPHRYKKFAHSPQRRLWPAFVRPGRFCCREFRHILGIRQTFELYLSEHFCRCTQNSEADLEARLALRIPAPLAPHTNEYRYSLAYRSREVSYHLVESLLGHSLPTSRRSLGSLARGMRLSSVHRSCARYHPYLKSLIAAPDYIWQIRHRNQ